jgi:hypothetical protein
MGGVGSVCEAEAALLVRRRDTHFVRRAQWVPEVGFHCKVNILGRFPLQSGYTKWVSTAQWIPEVGIRFVSRAARDRGTGLVWDSGDKVRVTRSE